jgi:glycosyltransferase EpsD
MNEVDMRLAQAHHLSNDKIAFVHGMGVDLKLFQDVRAHNSVRTDQDNFTFFYAAEFSKRKNHAFLLHAFEKSCEQMEKAMLCLAGQGALFESCRQLAKCLNIEDRVRFLGHVDDIPSRLASFDAVISASLSEGLPFNIIEAMAAGLPIIASDIKGHRDLLSGTPGELYRDETELIDKMVSVYNRGRCRVTYDHVVRYGLDRVMDEIISIYKESLRTS